MKYSFIVPVYDKEDYLAICLNSLLKQTYSNFEIILVNDGSNDHSMEIIREYHQKYHDKITIIDQENQGLSIARNEAVKIVTGDYFFFVDADDLIEPNLLETIEKQKKRVDLYKFGYKMIYQNGDSKEIKTYYNGLVISGEQAIKMIIKNKNVFEMAVLYGYKTSFYRENNFSFTKGKYHEDFGLIPYIILKSKSIQLLDEPFYLYLQTDNSITRNTNYEKTVQRAYDVLYYYESLKEKVKQTEVSEETKLVFSSFLANAVIGYVSLLNGKEKREYKSEIKDKHIIDDLLTNTWKRKFKKIVQKIKVSI